MTTPMLRVQVPGTRTEETPAGIDIMTASPRPRDEKHFVHVERENVHLLVVTWIRGSDLLGTATYLSNAEGQICHDHPLAKADGMPMSMALANLEMHWDELMAEIQNRAQMAGTEEPAVN